MSKQIFLFDNRKIIWISKKLNPNLEITKYEFFFLLLKVIGVKIYNVKELRINPYRLYLKRYEQTKE